MQTHSEKTSERKQNMFLIKGTTNEVVKGFKEYVKEGDELIKATVFFLQENFVFIIDSNNCYRMVVCWFFA